MNLCYMFVHICYRKLNSTDIALIVLFSFINCFNVLFQVTLWFVSKWQRWHFLVFFLLAFMNISYVRFSKQKKIPQKNHVIFCLFLWYVIELCHKASSIINILRKKLKCQHVTQHSHTILTQFTPCIQSDVLRILRQQFTWTQGRMDLLLMSSFKDNFDLFQHTIIRSCWTHAKCSCAYWTIAHIFQQSH